ncbi:tannase/feruloyl esterase family alpha/beta hydrolase [Actinomadura sp. NPDC048394]|jgi:feruloyl esterase|uniref:tannase/feruloyl esterase family alpha/beta hydrolase n=1 Tax=Actinomadura sp. NPDC048394 TaxID=3158223 RepID=UPI0033D62FF5
MAAAGVTVLALSSSGLVQTSSSAFAAPAREQARTITGAASKCASLVGLHLDAHRFGLPTQGADIDSATLTAADPTSGRPEFCLVRGKVNSVDAKAPDVNFEVNLPTSWNQKSVQFGGGGFNGVLVTGLDAVPGSGNTPTAQARSQPPINRGYATFGSDGGVAVGADPAGSFALNKEALANYAGESVKRTRDAAVGVIKRYYGVQPGKQYYVGGSKGGHEALVAAQRYGGDYDGIIAYYPANQNQAMVLSWYALLQAAYSHPGGYLDLADQQLVNKAVYSTCDKLDGAVDGVISNVQACDRTFDVESLRCPDAATHSETCLSPTQIETLKTAASPFKFAFPLAHGVTQIGPYPALRGADVSAWLDPNGDRRYTAYNSLADPVIRYFIEQDPNGSSVNFDYRQYEKRVKQLSWLYDATDPDIDRFAGHGGKLILVQGASPRDVDTDFRRQRSGYRWFSRS